MVHRNNSGPNMAKIALASLAVIACDAVRNRKGTGEPGTLPKVVRGVITGIAYSGEMIGLIVIGAEAAKALRPKEEPNADIMHDKRDVVQVLRDLALL